MGATEGIEHLEVPVKRREAEEAPEDLVDVGGKERGESTGGLFDHCLGDTFQRGVHVFGEAIDQEAVRRASQEEEGDCQEACIPQGKACPNRPHAHNHSAFST